MKERHIPLWDDKSTCQIQNVLGIIHNCLRVNVRNRPEKDSMIVGILPAFTPVIVDLYESTDSFYKISKYLTSDVMEGYCQKEYIDMSPPEG